MKVLKGFLLIYLVFAVMAAPSFADALDSCGGGDCAVGLRLVEGNGSHAPTSSEPSSPDGHCQLHHHSCCHSPIWMTGSPSGWQISFTQNSPFFEAYSFHFSPPCLDGPFQPPKA